MTPQQPAQDPSALDGPGAVIGRYLQLLRRRWWQVVPISLLGLVIGGISANFVPRDYVVSTEVQYSGSPFGSEGGTRNDPMAGEMRIAESTIPAHPLVESVLDDLGWTDFKVLDEAGRAEYVRETAATVRVDDVILGGDTRDREFLKIRIGYQNEDGDRAVEFCNELTIAWIDSRRSELVAQGDAELQRLRKRITSATENRDDLSKRIAAFERDNGLNPELRELGRTGNIQLIGGRGRELAKEIGEVQRELFPKQSELAVLENRFERGEIEPTRRVDLRKEQEAELPGPLRAKRDELLRSLLLLDAQIASVTDADSRKKDWVRARGLILDQARLLGLELGVSASADPEKGESPTHRMEENPVYAEERARLELLRSEIAALEQHRGELEAEQQRLQDRIARLPEVFVRYDDMRSRLETVSDHIKAMTEDQAEKEQLFARLQNRDVLKRTSRANKPKAPTDPSLLVLATIGSLLGLGVAIGLILAWDFLQATFKTVDDVESGLGVPVLGTMAHLETREERDAISDSRRRASFAAAILLFLTLSLVTVYYLAPARLPHAVLEVFDLILGPAR